MLINLIVIHLFLLQFSNQHIEFQYYKKITFNELP